MQLGDLNDEITPAEMLSVFGLNMAGTYRMPNRYSLARLEKRELEHHNETEHILYVDYNSMDEGFVNTRISSLIYVYSSFFSGLKNIPVRAHSNGNLIIAFATFCFAPKGSISFEHIKTLSNDLLNGYPVSDDTEEAFRKVMCFDISLYNAMNSIMYHREYWQYFKLSSIEGFNSHIYSTARQSLIQWAANKGPMLGSRVASQLIENVCRGDIGITSKGAAVRDVMPRVASVPTSCLLGFFHLGSFSVAQFIASKYAAGLYKSTAEAQSTLVPLVKHLVCGQGAYRSKEERVATTLLPPLGVGMAVMHPKRATTYYGTLIQNSLLGNSGNIFGRSISEIHHDGVVTARECLGMFWYNICSKHTKLLVLYGLHAGTHAYMYVSSREPKPSDETGWVMYNFLNDNEDNLSRDKNIDTCSSSQEKLSSYSKCKTCFGKNVNQLVQYKEQCRSSGLIYLHQS